ncbi:glycosyltransferase [Orenia marismortui]|uniref:Glycosyl transferase family 2 n=1 Tax=Orenia marismortui TaxID=46469 RepID=A0A4R8HFL0_9FIRM|nr:glycosyltransferase [Orenia marismortui]TDX58926.1 glycosyl transferase family 2 [Orenia marismortui]
MDFPLISIIVLSYNNLKYYKDCLDSVLMQNYGNIEIVFSDDSSEKFNKSNILDYINDNKNDNIKRITINQNDNNLGIIKNYNKAIRLSKGEYIFYIGLDDMLYDEDVISDVVDFFKETDSYIVTGYRAIYDQKMKNYLKILPRNNEKEFIQKGDPGYLHLKLSRGNFIAGSCTPFSRKLIQKYGYLDEDYILLEDYPRYLSLTRQGCKIDFIERKLIKYRLGGITTNNQKNEVLKKDIAKASEKEVGDFVSQFFQSKIKNIEEKEMIGWGAIGGYQDNKEIFSSKIKYFIDSDESKYKSLIDNKEVYSPKKILEEKKEEIFVVVFSRSHYNEISLILDSYGFEEFENYCCFSDLVISKQRSKNQ